jgi:hypothetical protein
MLDNFYVPVTTADGAVRVILVRDLPTCVFFLGPDPPHRGTEAWADAVLVRASITPPFTMESVARLGRDRDEPLLSYFRAVGYHDTREIAELAEAGLRVGRALADTFAWPAPSEVATPYRVPFAAQQPPQRRAMREVLGKLSDRVGVPPHVIWREWAISDFCLSWRVLVGDDLLSAATRRERD